MTRVTTLMHSIYLDHNATTPLADEAAAAMEECRRAAWANPSSQHAAGRRARRVLEDAREGIARILGADIASSQPDRLIFTSGGTDANNLALLGLAGATPSQVIVSAIEHPSVQGAAEELARRGHPVARLGVAADGIIRIADLPALLARPTSLVSLMLGNNETGVLQPVAEAATLCAAAGIPLHTDASQVAGKLPIDFQALGVAALTVAAHKFHGPRGIGALLLRHGLSPRPLLYGGVQQEGLRPGTECVELAAGMFAALAAWERDHTARTARMARLRDLFEQRLQAYAVTAGLNFVVHGLAAPRLPHVSCLAFPGLDRQALLMALDLAGVACSSGSACASGSSEPSPTLAAMGCPPDVLESSLRFSLGAGTTESDIVAAVERISLACNDLRRQKRA